jgi:NAD/NADP transhydrogenase alpha subunit
MRLRHVVYLMTNAVIVGGLIILVVALGLVGYAAIFGAIVLGFLLAWPISILVAKRIKAEDPAWNADKDRPTRAALAERIGQGRDA